MKTCCLYLLHFQPTAHHYFFRWILYTKSIRVRCLFLLQFLLCGIARQSGKGFSGFLVLKAVGLWHFSPPFKFSVKHSIKPVPVVKAAVYTSFIEDARKSNSPFYWFFFKKFYKIRFYELKSDSYLKGYSFIQYRYQLGERRTPPVL